MTFKDSMIFTRAVEVIRKLQEEGKLAGTVSICGYLPEVFMIGADRPEDLPAGEIRYKPRDCDEYPWEASTKVGDVRYYALIPADECWKLYLDFAA